MYTVMLLDDHEMVRQGIELGLNKEGDFDVIGSFGTGRDLLEALSRRPADVVVMDFILAPSDSDGLSLLQALNRRFGKCRPPETGNTRPKSTGYTRTVAPAFSAIAVKRSWPK